MLFIIFPVVHQPSIGGSCGDEDSWCSECAGREGGAAGVMGGGGVATAELNGVATLLGGVADDDGAGVASFLKGEGEELRVMAGVVVGAADALPVKAAAAVVLKAGDAAVMLEDMSVAEGTKGLASTLRADLTVVVEGYVSAEANGDGLVDRTEVGGRSVVTFEGLRTEVACEAGMPISDFAMGAVAREGVLVIGVVVCESGVEPGGVWRTESRKEKVWETGLRFSPVISARLSLTSTAELFLPGTLVAALMVGSGLLVDTFTSFAF